MSSASLTLASQTIGIISFSITLILLLGVYRDLITTLRTANTHINIALGNLRQEILFERAFIACRLADGDEFGVFPRKLRYIKSAIGRRDKTRRAFAELFHRTMKTLWIEFRNVERPFLIRSGMRAEEVRRGNYWSEEDLSEKPRGRLGRRRRRRRKSGKGGEDKDDGVKDVEQGVNGLGVLHYRTDLAHRFIWWQSKDDVERLADQVQRIQIRRMERDLYETDELVKSGGRGGGHGWASGSGSSSGSDGGGKRGGSVRSRVASRAGSVRSVRMPSRRGSMGGRNVMEVDEREIVRRRLPSPASIRQTEMEASNTGRRRDRRAESTVENEVLRPGSVYVDVGDRPRRTSGYEDRRAEQSRRS